MYNTLEQFKLTAYPSGSFSSIPDAVIEEHLNAAAADINCALRVHHTLPLNTSTFATDLANIRRAERIIAGFNLLIYRGLEPNVENTADAVLYNQYQETKEWLTQIANGKVIFPKSADATPAISEGRPKAYGGAINSSGIRTNNSGFRVI